MAVEIKLQFNGKSLTIPINPEELNLSRSADNEDINIIGIGPVSRKGHPGLYNLSIESFFPGEKSYFYTGVKPKTCVDFIDEIWKADNKNNNVAKIVTTGLTKNLNMYFVIEDFEWDYKAGEEDDIYYNLKIKEYIPYGVKLVKTDKKTNKAKSSSSKSRTKSTSTSKSKKNTYKVQKGDCLWNIAKAASGKGSNWKQLYNLNKKVIGSNPNLIKPGQILTLPDGWKGSFKVAKLTGSSKKRITKRYSTTKSKVSSNTKSKTKSKKIKVVQAPKIINNGSTTYKRTVGPSLTQSTNFRTVKVTQTMDKKALVKYMHSNLRSKIHFYKSSKSGGGFR